MALDTPANLKKLIKNNDLTVFSVTIANLTQSMVAKLQALDCTVAMAQTDSNNLKISVKGGDGFDRVLDAIRASGGIISGLNTSEPTLEDVFLSVTGKQMRDEANEKAAPTRRRHGPWGAPRARVR